MENISIGAEATVYKKGGCIVKVRHPKTYRIPEIDMSIRKARTRFESKLLKKIEVLEIEIAPKLLSDKAMQDLLDSTSGFFGACIDYAIFMEYLEGCTLRECFNEQGKAGLHAGLLRSVYECIGTLHRNQIVHGDLTPNNIIVNNGKIKIIDFGLGKITSKVEDMAVDLYVFEKIIATMVDFSADSGLDNIITAYLAGNTANGKEVLARVKEVRRRGRKRELSAIG